MTDLVNTAASVAYVSGDVAADQVAGEAFVAGALLYKTSAGTWKKAQGDGTAEEAGSLGLGLALFTADAANARGSVALPGAIVTLGAATAGAVYSTADTAGAIRPVADNATTDKVTVCGVGIGSNKILLARIYDAGCVVP